MRKLVATVAAVMVLALAVPAWACSVPVFRYALERWEAAPYRVTVFAKGELQAGPKKIVQTIEDFSAASKGYANVAVTVIDVSKPLEKDDELLWNEQKASAEAVKAAESGGWAVVRYPEEDDKPDVIWAGVLDDARVANLLDSPARREVAKRILSGQSAVWVVVESGDKSADKKAAKLLAEELPKLEKSLVLPEQDPDDPRGLRSELPLKIAFSTVTIPAGASDESQFVRMLMAADKDAVAAKGPMVFPIFGRGRALPAMFGEDLSARRIAEYATFLTGACSCEVKQLNPGTDVLMAADWSAILEGRKIVEPAKLAGAVAIPPGSRTAPATMVASPVKLVAITPVTEVYDPTRTWLIAGLAAAGVAVVASGVYAVARSRKAGRA